MIALTESTARRGVRFRTAEVGVQVKTANEVRLALVDAILSARVSHLI